MAGGAVEIKLAVNKFYIGIQAGNFIVFAIPTIIGGLAIFLIKIND
jgi:hypothetical protein